MTEMTTICPSCGSGKVSPHQDNNEVHECAECGWVGQARQLVQVPLPKNPNSLEINENRALDIAREMSKKYMELLYAGASQPIGQCLLQAGMVGRRDVKNMTRMIRAACLGAHKATLDEADAIAKEHKASELLS